MKVSFFFFFIKFSFLLEKRKKEKFFIFTTGDEDQAEINQGRNALHHTNAVHSLFPSCLCSAVIQIISLLDDAAVSSDGNAVYEVAYSVKIIYLIIFISFQVNQSKLKISFSPISPGDMELFSRRFGFISSLYIRTYNPGKTGSNV